MNGANLSGANLEGADLRGASMQRTDFSGANLLGANLRNATCEKCSFSGAILRSADFDGMSVDLDLRSFDFSALEGAQNLDSIRGSRSHLIKLRKGLREAGYRKEERDLTAAIRRVDPPVLDTILFDWTCGYGANSYRLIWCFLLIWAVSGCLYFMCLQQSGRAGLYLRVDGTAPGRRCREGRAIFTKKLKYRFDIVAAARTAAFFSLMSSLNLGVRGMAFKSWILTLQPREFDIKACGWPRAVSGIQAVTSFLLLALFLASFFGRPFDEPIL